MENNIAQDNRRLAYLWLKRDYLIDFLIERNIPESVIEKDVRYTDYQDFPWEEWKKKNRRHKIAKLLP